MFAGIFILYAWGIGLLAFSVVMCIIGCKFILRARKYKKMQEDIVKKVEVRTRKEYNKIATMSPKDLGEYLSTVFARVLELEAATHVSEKDHDAAERLYGYSVASLCTYLGPETIAAIDYYYGANYVQRWSYHTFRLLSNRGIITAIINKRHSENVVVKNTM